MYSVKKRRKVILKLKNNQLPSSKRKSLRQIAKEESIKSHKTLINWQPQSQMAQSVKARLARHDRKNLLNIDQRRLLAGCILWFRSN
jgi:hypothetical protein